MVFEWFYFMLLEINIGNRKQFPPRGEKLVLKVKMFEGDS